MKKILIVSTTGLGYDGITSVIYNYVIHMNREGMELDFTAFEDTNEEQKRKFGQVGFVHILPDRKKNFPGYVRALSRILKKGYDVVHVHGNSGTMVAEAVCARMCGVFRIIVHGHNTTCSHMWVHKILRVPMMWMAAERLACSDKAGKWLYGNKRYTVLNNAVDLKQFQYNPQKRKSYREEFGVKDAFVIGHSGRFHRQKNHDFLIDIFAEYLGMEPQAKLLLVGDGEELQNIRRKVRRLGLEDHVVFAGRRSDAWEIYSAMDLFLLPSLWEGLPVVMVEAQANGLPVLVSDNITKEAECTDRVFWFDLKKSAAEWAEKIRDIRERAYDRAEELREEIRGKGFDIENEAGVLRKIYFE